MNSLFTFISLICLLLVPGIVQGLDWKAEFTSGLGSTDNLIKDSTDLYDAYSISTLRFNLYPIKGLEIGLRGEQSYYRELIGISSVLGGVSVTYMPLNPDSRFALYLQGDLSGRLYHSDFSGFDNNIGEARASIGYRLHDTFVLRGGTAFRSTRYVNSGTPYKRDLDFFVGGNFALPVGNVFDIEAGFSRTNYLHKDNLVGDSIPPDWTSPWPVEDWFLPWVGESESTLWMFYWSPRLSRSIGEKTGISLMYSAQHFQNYDKEIIWGFTSGYLSPWASVWEGEYVALKVKSYLISNLIISAGTGYWDKLYLKTIEADLANPFVTYGRAKREINRNDWQTRSFVRIQFPFVLDRKYFIEYSVNLEYTDNKSNKQLYDYNNITFSTNLTFRL